VPRRWGNAHASLVPYQVFTVSDGEIVVAVGNDGQWQQYCAAIERPEGGTVATIASPLRLSETPPVYDRAPPTLGDSTWQVLTDLLGLSADEVARHRAAGIV
jgi:crotonobetainyl-CoA:carnitine CoA-transferase CaiB-like acyl-CoA transferase